MLKAVFLNRLFIGVWVLLVCGVVSVYFLHTDTPEEPIKVYKPVEPLEKPTAEALVGDTSRGGHFHEDGTWHAEPHTPEDFSEVTTEVQGARDVAQEANAHVTTPMPDLSKLPTRTQESREAFDAWVDKYMELGDKNRQLSQELLDLLPDTVEGWERYHNDENVKREVQRAIRDVAARTGEIHKMIAAHKKERPVGP